MKAVILAAGEGKRMHPLTCTRPKVMLPIANKPIMEHLLLEMIKAGIRDFNLVIGYHGETIRQHFGDGEKWGVSIEYTTQRKQQGTAHALKMVQNFTDGKFILANGDILVGVDDIAKVMAQDNVSIGVIEVQDTRGLGVLEMAGDRIEGIHEKVANPPSNIINAGIYLMTSDIFDAIDKTGKSPRGEYELTESLQIMLRENATLKGVELDHWLDVSYPWQLLEANSVLMDGIEKQNLGTVDDNVVINGPVSVGNGTHIRANSYITGPVVIGENCDIGPNCFIRPSTAIGDNCHIGSAVELKNSIIMKETKIPHHNYVGDSVIGERCNLGAGTKIANLRLDKKNISISGIDTGLRKLGAIIGDDVQTGINASINVGTMIGDNTFIGVGAVASGVVLPNSRIF